MVGDSSNPAERIETLLVTTFMVPCQPAGAGNIRFGYGIWEIYRKDRAAIVLDSVLCLFRAWLCTVRKISEVYCTDIAAVRLL
jgi:hypothetical protein